MIVTILTRKTSLIEELLTTTKEVLIKPSTGARRGAWRVPTFYKFRIFFYCSGNAQNQCPSFIDRILVPSRRQYFFVYINLSP